jgi:hypothetical protein
MRSFEYTILRETVTFVHIPQKRVNVRIVPRVTSNVPGTLKSPTAPPVWGFCVELGDADFVLVLDRARVEVTTAEVGESDAVAVPCSTVIYVPATRAPRPLSLM